MRRKVSGVRGELLNRCDIFRVEGTIDDSDSIGVAERAQRLSKWTARKNPAISKSESSVDRDQIQVAL
jgi:hypothetical protein